MQLAGICTKYWQINTVKQTKARYNLISARYLERDRATGLQKVNEKNKLAVNEFNESNYTCLPAFTPTNINMILYYIMYAGYPCQHNTYSSD